MDIVSNNGVLRLSPNLTNYGDSTWKDGYFTVSGSIGLANPEQGEMYCETYYPVTEGDSYTLSFNYGGDTLPSNTWACFAFYDSSKNFLSRTANSASISSNPKTYTTTIQSGCSYIRISLRTYKNSDNAVYNVQLEKGGSATTYIPYGIYTDGTVEKIAVKGPNIFDNANTSLDVGQYLHVDTHDVRNGTNELSVIYQLVPGKTYTLTRLATGASIKMRLGFFDTATPAVGSVASDYMFDNNFNTTSMTFTVPAGKPYMFATLANSTNSGRTITEQQCLDAIRIMETVSTATAEMLLKVGTYQDVQSVLDGAVTRNVGIKVLDGTETYTLSGSYISISKNTYFPDANLPSGSTNVISTHFLVGGAGSTNAIYVGGANMNFTVTGTFATTTAWTNWLKAQYNAGQPVIIVYPLATATTESVTAQSLTTQAGTNIVEITQGSIDDLSLEVSYKATV